MATLFCTNCGFIIARGEIDDPQQALRDSPYEACPRCGTDTGIGWSPSELSEADIRLALGQADGSGMDPVDRMLLEAGRELEAQRAKRGLLRMLLVMLAVGIPAGAVSYYLSPGWGWAAMVGVLAGMVAIWVVDKLSPSWFE